MCAGGIIPPAHNSCGSVKALARCMAGALFLLNPNFNLIDILPDAIGFMLIVSGLRAFEAASPSIAEARNRFQKLLRISLLRIAALPMIFIVGDNEKTFILIFTFVFALIETFYLLPAFHYFYDGTAYLSVRFGGESIKKSPPRVITAIFMIARGALNVLPELRYLPTQYEDESLYSGEYRSFKLAELQHMLTLVNIIFTLAFAAVWIIMFRRYINRLRKDETLISALDATLADTPREEGALLLGTLKSVFTLVSIAMFASIDFYADGLNLIPDLIPAILLLLAVVMLYRRGQCERNIIVVASVYTALTAVLVVLNNFYAKRYYAFAAIGNAAALRVKAVQDVLAAIGSAVFILLMFLLCRALVIVTDRHAGLFAEPEFRTKNEKTQRQRLRIRNLIWSCFLLAVAAEAMQTIYSIFILDYPIMWIPSAVLTITLGALTMVTTGDLYYGVELRYGK